MTSPSWNTKDPRELTLKCWDDECVVYNGCTGQTHLVDPFAAAALEALIAAAVPIGAYNLAAQLAAEADVALDDHFLERVQQTIADLERAGLIEQDKTQC